MTLAQQLLTANGISLTRSKPTGPASKVPADPALPAATAIPTGLPSPPASGSSEHVLGDNELHALLLELAACATDDRLPLTNKGLEATVEREVERRVAQRYHAQATARG